MPTREMVEAWGERAREAAALDALGQLPYPEAEEAPAERDAFDVYAAILRLEERLARVEARLEGLQPPRE